MKRRFVFLILLLYPMLAMKADAVSTLYIGSEAGRQVLPPETFQVTPVYSFAYLNPLAENSGFEWDDDQDGVPDGWQWEAGDSAATLSSDSNDVRSGQKAARIRVLGYTPKAIEAKLSLPVQVKADRKYRITCFAKTEGLQGQISLRASVSSASQESPAVVSAPDWQPLSVELVPEADDIVIIELVVSAVAGTVLLDDLCVQCAPAENSIEESTITEQLLKDKKLVFFNRIDLSRLTSEETNVLIDYLVQGGALFLSGCPGISHQLDMWHLLPLRLGTRFGAPGWIHFQKVESESDFLKDFNCPDSVQTRLLESEEKISSRTWLVTLENQAPLLTIQNRIGLLTLDIDGLLLDAPDTMGIKKDFVAQMGQLMNDSASQLLSEQPFPVVPSLEFPEVIQVGASVRFQAAVKDLRTQRKSLKAKFSIQRKNRQVLAETIELFTDYSGTATGFTTHQFQVPGQYIVQLLVFDGSQSVSYQTECQVSSPIEISIGETRAAYTPGTPLKATILVKNNSDEKCSFNMVVVFSGPNGPIDAIQQDISINSRSSASYLLERPWDDLISGDYSLSSTLYDDAQQTVAVDSENVGFSALPPGTLQNENGVLTLNGEPFFLTGAGVRKPLRLKNSFALNSVLLFGGWSELGENITPGEARKILEHIAMGGLYGFYCLGYEGHPEWMQSTPMNPFMLDASGEPSSRTMDICIDHPEFKEAFAAYLDSTVRETSGIASLLGYVVWDRPALPTGGCYNRYTLKRYGEWTIPQRRQVQPLENILETGIGIIGGLDPINQASKLLARPTRTPVADPDSITSFSPQEKRWIRFNQENLGEFLNESAAAIRAQAARQTISIKRKDTDFGADEFARFTMVPKGNTTRPTASIAIENLNGISVEQSEPFDVMAEAEYLSSSNLNPAVTFGMSTPEGLTAGRLWSNCWALVGAGQKGVFAESLEALSSLPMEVQNKFRDFNKLVAEQRAIWSAPKMAAGVAVLNTESRAAKGAYELLRRSGYHVDILSPENLSTALKAYSVIMVPTGFNDINLLSDYREQGSKVILFESCLDSASFKMPDETGEAVLRLEKDIFYCSFEPKYSEARRKLLEPVLNDIGLLPPVQALLDGETATDVLVSMLESGANRYAIVINTGSEKKSLRLLVQAPYGTVYDLRRKTQVNCESVGTSRWAVESEVECEDVLLLAFTPQLKRIDISAPEEVFAGSPATTIKASVSSEGNRPLVLDFIRPYGGILSSKQGYSSSGLWKSDWVIPRNLPEGVWRLRLRDLITDMESVAIVEVLPSKKSALSSNKMSLKSQ